MLRKACAARQRGQTDAVIDGWRSLDGCKSAGPAQATAGLAMFSSRSSLRFSVPLEPQHDLPAFSTLSLLAVVQSHEGQVQLEPQVHEVASLLRSSSAGAHDVTMSLALRRLGEAANGSSQPGASQRPLIGLPSTLSVLVAGAAAQVALRALQTPNQTVVCHRFGRRLRSVRVAGRQDGMLPSQLVHHNGDDEMRTGWQGHLRTEPSACLMSGQPQACAPQHHCSAGN